MTIYAVKLNCLQLSFVPSPAPSVRPSSGAFVLSSLYSTRRLSIRPSFFRSFVFSFVPSSACFSFVRPFARPSVVYWCVRLVILLFVFSFVPLFYYPSSACSFVFFVCSFVRPSVSSFVRSFVISFLRSFVLSFDSSFVSPADHS